MVRGVVCISNNTNNRKKGRYLAEWVLSLLFKALGFTVMGFEIIVPNK